MDKLDRKDLIESVLIPKDATLLKGIIKNRKFKIAAFFFSSFLFACLMFFVWKYIVKLIALIDNIKLAVSNHHFGLTVNSILRKQDFFPMSFVNGALWATGILLFFWICAYFLGHKKKVIRNTQIIALSSKIKDMENINSEMTQQLNQKVAELEKTRLLDEKLCAATKEAERQNNQYNRLKILFEDLTSQYNEILVANGFKDKKIDNLEKLLDKTKEKMTFTITELEKNLSLKDEEIKSLKSMGKKSAGFSFFNILRGKGE